MRDATFGQFYPSHSFVHRLDPRTKILFLIVYIAAIFTSNSFWALGVCAAMFLLIVCFAGIPFSSLLRSVRGVLFLLLFLG